MNRKYIPIKSLFLSTMLICLLLVTSILAGVAFAQWNVYLSETLKSNVSARADDIAENYSFTDSSNQTNDAEYTLYLFPSAVYLDWYYDYLEQTSSTLLGVVNNKPEDLFGCVELSFDSAGEMVYEVKGKNGGDDGYLSFMASTGKSVYYRSTGYYDTAYVTPYSGNSEWTKDITLADGTSIKKYSFGDPQDDQTLVEYSSWTNAEQHNYRNLHVYDRLGYWGEYARGAGRYLPIKMTINPRVSSTTLSKAINFPLTDMGDSNGWYCYSFTNWAYCLTSLSGTPKAPYYASEEFLKNGGSGFGSKTMGAFATTYVDNEFDFSEDFSLYADSDGVIRLFPVFSQGKTYGATNYEDGGGDALRIVPKYTSESVFNQHDRYISYSSGGGDYITDTNVTINGIRVASLMNMNLDVFSQATIQIDISRGYGGWVGNWNDVCTIDFSSIINNYGMGLYNMYVFITDIGSSTSTSNTAIQAFSNLFLSDLRIGGGNTKTLFPELTFRSFFTLDSDESATFTVTSSGLTKAISFAFEKKYDPKVYILPTPDEIDENGNPKFIESKLKELYNSSNNVFKYMTQPLYSVQSGAMMVDTSMDKLQIKHPNCYIYYGLDFTESNDIYFHIRHQEQMRSNARLSTDEDTDADAEIGKGHDLIYNCNEDGEFDNASRFKYAIAADANDTNGYFIVEMCTVVQDQNSEGVGYFLKLKNNNMKGIYDILLVDDIQPDGEIVVYVYAYQRTQVTIKILANDVTDTDNDGFADHLFSSSSEVNNCLIFQKGYAYANEMKCEDLNDTIGYGGSQFILKNYTYSKLGDSLASCVNDYVSALATSPGSVVLRDHVTGAVMAEYEEVETADEYTLSYGGKNYKLTFMDFTIRKNYVIYISVN